MSICTTVNLLYYMRSHAGVFIIMLREAKKREREWCTHQYVDMRQLFDAGKIIRCINCLSLLHVWSEKLFMYVYTHAQISDCEILKSFKTHRTNVNEMLIWTYYYVNCGCEKKKWGMYTWEIPIGRKWERKKTTIKHLIPNRNLHHNINSYTESIHIGAYTHTHIAWKLFLREQIAMDIMFEWRSHI